MQVSTYWTLRSALISMLFGMTSLAHADADDSYVSAMRYVSLDVSGDNNDSRQYSGAGSYTFGKYFWLDGTIGRLKDDNGNLGDLTNYGVGAGVKGEHLQFAVNFSHYRNNADYTQRDITAAADWIANRYSFGVDAFHRSSEDVYNNAVTDTFPLLGVGQFMDLVGLCALGCSVAAAPSRTKRPSTSSPP
jgi:hypothetical protein